MGKKDKKSKTTEQKARIAAKQTKKAAQKDRKAKSKGGDDSEGEVVDLESVLEEYAKQQAQYLKVTETPCEPPSARSSSTLIGSPSNSRELFLFGGENYNGSLATFFNDLFVYHIDRDEWRIITSPNSPLPRSGHAWCRGGNAGGIYLFGGEFSSPKQGTFYHYNDFWRLDTTTREWTKLESKGKGPPARSGHRMTYFKNYILLFGGFQDTSQQTKYLQDIWVYDCQNFAWYNPPIPPATQKPDARSSFTFLPHEGGAVLYGGYSRIKSTAAANKQSKGTTQTIRSILKPIVHQDTWSLRVIQPPSDTSGPVQPTIRWERRKKPANAPNPNRAGITMAYHKGRGILFGGVHDVEESEEGIESEFFNNLYAWNVERNRFFQLSLRRARPVTRRVADDRSNIRRGRGEADQADLLRNLAALETKNIIPEVDENTLNLPPDIEISSIKAEKPVSTTMPSPRFNAQLAIQDDTLFIFGGTYEHGDREFTFDELWAIDLGKLDGVKQIYKRELENWQGSDEESESESNDEDELEDEDTEAKNLQEEPSDPILPESLPDTVNNTMLDRQTDVEIEEPDVKIADDRPHPRPFESLREFFSRTSTLWQQIVLETSRSGSTSTADTSIKELRKTAFDMAETKWWDCREEITTLEEEQENAGIGEVISIPDRSNELGGAGRRR